MNTKSKVLLLVLVSVQRGSGAKWNFEIRQPWNTWITHYPLHNSKSLLIRCWLQTLTCCRRSWPRLVDCSAEGWWVLGCCAQILSIGGGGGGAGIIRRTTTTTLLQHISPPADRKEARQTAEQPSRGGGGVVEVQTRLVRHRLFLSKLSLTQVSNSDFLEVVERRKRITKSNFCAASICPLHHRPLYRSRLCRCGGRASGTTTYQRSDGKLQQARETGGFKLLVCRPTCGDYHLRVIEQKYELRSLFLCRLPTSLMPLCSSLVSPFSRLWMWSVSFSLSTITNDQWWKWLMLIKLNVLHLLLAWKSGYGRPWEDLQSEIGLMFTSYDDDDYWLIIMMMLVIICEHCTYAASIKGENLLFFRTRRISFWQQTSGSTWWVFEADCKPSVIVDSK